MNLHDLDHRGISVVFHPCPSGHADHQLLQLQDDVLAPLGLGRGSMLHADRGRAPRNGDLVWVELTRNGSIQRLVRRYDESEDVVTLSVPGQSAIMRDRLELMVLGAVERSPHRSCRDGSS